MLCLNNIEDMTASCKRVTQDPAPTIHNAFNMFHYLEPPGRATDSGAAK